MRTGLIALSLVALSVGPGAAQRTSPIGVPGAAELTFPAPPPVVEALRTPAGAFVASLAVPGAGQAALGLRRWPAYVVLEAGFWWLWADARGDFRGYRDGYRDLAWDVARIQEGPREDGGWPYYEAMSHYLASGAFDIDAAPGIQPEEDPSTYNGSVWEVARGIYLPGGVPDPGAPEYAAALSWYEARAAGPGFMWNWTGQPAALMEFRDLIAAADDSRRTQTTALGVILANHLVSAIDALIAARLRGPVRPELESGLVPTPGGSAWALRVRLPLTDRHERDG